MGGKWDGRWMNVGWMLDRIGMNVGWIWDESEVVVG